MGQLDRPPIADGATCKVVRRVNAYFQYERPRAWVPVDLIPSLPDDQQRVLHCIFGVLPITNDPPNGPNHAVLDGTDDLVVNLLCVAHGAWRKVRRSPIRPGRLAIPIIVTAKSAGFVDKKTVIV
jgi:hypothetical protein